jgi:hypothetical protein
MGNVRNLQRSFAGGEVSPEMFGRIDDAKYQAGLALCRNFIPKPQGPAQNRAGFAFVREAKDSTKKVRLIPFTYSTTQTMVIELGAGYFRFHTQGATLQTSGVPALPANVVNSIAISIASPGVVTWNNHGFAAGVPLRIVTNGVLPAGLSSGVVYYVVNPTANTFQLATAANGAGINTSGAQSGTHYAVYQFNTGDLFTSNGTQYYKTSNSATFVVKNIANNSGKIRVTTDYDFLSLSEGARVRIFGVAGTTEANGEWTISNLILTSLPSFNLSFDLNASVYVNAYTGGGVATTSVSPGNFPTSWYGLTASTYEVPSPYAEADLFNLHYVQSADVLTLTHPNYPPAELRRLGATNWQLSTLSFAAAILPPSAPTATATGSGSINYSYVVTATAADGVSESAASAAAVCTGNLFTTGNKNTISWSTVSGAAQYSVYKMQGGLYGYIGQTTSTSLVDDNIAPDLSKTPPTYDAVFGSPGDYPAAVSYFEQRRCFAGTTNKPQNIWMTKSGTESNMSYSLPIRDDDRIAFRVAAREANTIRHIVPLTQLLLMTSAAEWRVTSVNSDAITPTTISVRPQSYVGASNVQPVIINNTLIYGAARGGHIRELAYSWQSNGFVTGDLSLRAPHLFDTYDVVDMAYAKAPLPIVWFVSTSGKLLGLTYVPEQQIGAWHQHDTDGSFESCTVVAEGGEDALYCVVRRTINGVNKRYIERMSSRQFVNQADAFFVDCGLTYSGAAVTTISGLSHLEGKEVSILADGAVHPQRVVTGGTITLDQAASKVQIGLPITADLQTLPVAMQIDGSFGQGRYKNVNKAWLRVYRSSGIFVGPDVNSLTEAKQRTTEPYGSPPALKSDELQIQLTPSWGDSGQIFVRQSDPLPLTVVSMTAEIALGG